MIKENFFHCKICKFSNKVLFKQQVALQMALCSMLTLL